MKKTYQILLVTLLILITVASIGCRLYEFKGKVLNKQEDETSELEVVEISACRTVELKESGQRNCSAVIAVGDDSDNNQIKGIIVFDIKNLHDREVLKTSVNISGIHTYLRPSFWEKVIVENVDIIDFSCRGDYIACFEVGNYMDSFIASENLTKTINDSLKEEKGEYYLRFKLKNPTNNDNIEDLLILNTHDAYLKIEF
jgi:hypothetical protein